IEKLFNYGTNTGGKYLAGDMLTYGTNCSDVSGNPIGYCNVTQNREVWGNSKMTIRRMVIDLDAYYSNQSVLTNGVNLTKNITQIQQDIAWANSRGDKILLGIYRVPTAYANVTSQCWSDNRSCMPNNFTIYNNIILDLINQSTSSGTYLNTIYALEIGNEYDSASFFLNNLTNVNANTPNRTLLYQQLYRNIYYAVKAQYPSLRIGGYASLAYQQYSNDFWENNSKALYNITDFFSIHPYWYDVIGTSYSSYVNLKYNQVCSNFTALEGYCPEVILSEFGVDNSSITNDTANINLYQSMISQAIDTLLNINPSNITFINYQFTHTNWILSEARWQMFSPSNMQNRFYGLYNVYANHTRYAPSGATVYNTSIDNNEIIGVSTKTGSTCSMIITNSVNDYQNATVNFDSSCGKQLIDVETGQMITSGQQITQAPSDISYLTTPTVVYNGSQAILVNYLNEKIRDATTGEFSSGESQRQGFCSTALSGYTGFTSQITTMMIILGALIVLSVVVILVKVIQDEGSIDLASNGFISNLGDVKLFFGGILAIAMLLFVGVSVLGALCSM
ncbi:MAG TPA: hypothetical protein VIR31_04460, partial [Nitrososphaeraceae archaeon]